MARTTSAIVEPSPEDLCRSFLLCYATSQFPNYQIAKHHQLIARHLEAIEKREINRLLINVPPRHGKCCHPDTLISFPQGVKLPAKNINPGMQVLGHKNGTLISTTVVATERAFKPTVVVLTASGRSITVSDDHPLLTSDLVYVQAAHLKPGDYLPCVKSYHDKNLFNDKVINVSASNPQELVHIQTTGEHNYIANDFVSHNTMLTSEFFIAWYLGRNPTHEVMFATYSKDRAQDTGLKVKQQMERDSYKAFFSTRLRSDSKSKSHLATTDGGALYCVGVGGALTGRGANLFVMDDLVKSREEAESASARLRIVEWFKGTAYTRLMKNGAVVFISTRWHTQDLAGVILQEYKDKWVHLDLPAICIKNKDILGRKKGDPLWPEMFSARDLREIKKVIGTREFNAQYQQQPIGEEGSIIKLDWFQRYDNNNPPEFDRIIQSWDTAYDSKSIHDPSVCTVWGEVRKTGRFYLLDVLRSRMEYPMVKQAIHAMYDRYPKTTRILVENRTSGKSIVKDLQQTSLPILPIIGTGDKIVRLMAVSGLFEAGKVYLPESAPWLYDYETELCQFPVGAHDDQVDSTSQALDYLKQPHCQPSPRPLFWK